MAERLLFRDFERLSREFDTDLQALEYVFDNTFHFSSSEPRARLQATLKKHEKRLPPAVSDALRSEWQELEEARAVSPETIAERYIFGGVRFYGALRAPVAYLRKDLSWLHERLPMSGKRRLHEIIDSHRQRLTWTSHSVLQREWLKYERDLERAA